MKLVTIGEICQMVSENVSAVRCTVSPSGDQIAVEFNNRPDVVIHLLTPYYQNKLKNGGIPEEDIPPLIDEVRKLAENRVYSDAIIADLNSWLNESNRARFSGLWNHKTE